MADDSASSLELTWKSVGVPIKRCEFIRARKKFINISNVELEDLISSVLSSLPVEDKNFIENNISPTLMETLTGKIEDKTEYLWNLIKLIMYNYKKYKLQFYEAVKDADLAKVLFLEKKLFFHYEALRNIKKRLIGGKDLMYIDMPEYMCF
ncbi:MAG: hypothetical protein ABC612_08280 [Candidatus Methanosuratincola petrocarbonis]